MAAHDKHISVVESAVSACLAAHQLDDRPLCVGFSGGADSSVLLGALKRLGVANLRAVHIDHQLHPDSPAWADHCHTVCEQLQIPLTVIPVAIDSSAGRGIEAAAREARYAALEAEMQAGEFLLTAHHRGDQLETFLLQLFRGAGVQGLAAMPDLGQLGSLQVVRPLLDVSAAEVRTYAAAVGIEWLEDPSNTDTAFDRNYLRHAVVPRILERWPAAEQAVARAARLNGEALEILAVAAMQDMGAALRGNRLAIDPLRVLSPARRRNVVRTALQSLDLAIPSEKQLRESLDMLLGARADSVPEASWPGVRIYRFRAALWFYAVADDPGNSPPPADGYRWNTAESLNMGPIRGLLELSEGSDNAIAVEYLQDELDVRFRSGGERLRISPGGHTRDFKNLLQESAVPPWMRSQIPLIYSGERLLAVGDLWVNADFGPAAGQRGRVVRWQSYSPIR